MTATKQTELLPCPFCGVTPELPSGDGTQYEIECSGCGQAMASVQICDLMTLVERSADTFKEYRYGEEFIERAKAQAIKHWNTRAQSAEPAQSCRWVRDEDNDTYITKCGSAWHYSDGGYPEEHGQFYCHHCGKQIDEEGDNDE
jgi:Lar family restriction alleviation protein